ncbi:hypothetical protein QF042_003500 [Pedobacter sp. W3I1]|nr:hypothetical protein [Pedobacter sp. W3I1]MDQ0639935.1 hypothetical protein [Pedobacter sp. W3I1]
MALNLMALTGYLGNTTQRQKELSRELPTVEESVKHYCQDRGLI